MATVTVTEHEVLEFVPNPSFDRAVFASMADMHHATLRSGYYGGVRLLRAACKRFFELCTAAGIEDRLKKNFRLAYTTTVPTQVGMAGSSAIISATFKALMRFYAVTLLDLGIPKPKLPDVILSVERDELGIAAGLQDRVVQVYQGLVYMDFDQVLFAAQGHGDYSLLPLPSLPPLYLAWAREAAGESGKAHSDVRDRFHHGDADVVAAMRTFAGFADEGRKALEGGDVAALRRLMDANFALRRKTFGDAVVGAHNIAMVDAAKSLGCSAKFTGSGGAIVLLPDSEMTAEQEARAEEVFAALNCGFARARPQDTVEEDFM